jgi:hypothetical protein
MGVTVSGKSAGLATDCNARDPAKSQRWNAPSPRPARKGLVDGRDVRRSE